MLQKVKMEIRAGELLDWGRNYSALSFVWTPISMSTITRPHIAFPVSVLAWWISKWAFFSVGLVFVLVMLERSIIEVCEFCVCRWKCSASWFDFSSESSAKSGAGMTTGDFTILSHLKELGCGELLRKPREIHFSGCINESYAFHCSGGDFFVKINRSVADVSSSWYSDAPTKPRNWNARHWEVSSNANAEQHVLLLFQTLTERDITFGFWFWFRAFDMDSMFVGESEA